jgi:hypothetical protein
MARNWLLLPPSPDNTMTDTLKTIAGIAAFFGMLALCPDMPTPAPYEPTHDAAARVREFVRGERDTLEEADLYSESVSPELRRAAQLILNP